MRIRKRRRRESKTDYKSRINLLKSEKPRIVFRKTNKYVIGQFIKSEEAKDKVIVGVNSKMLLKYGWPKEASGGLKSIPASYLTGFLLGKKITANENEIEAIFDIGLLKNIPKSRVYAFLKGIVDSGIKIKSDEKIFPAEKRILGEHLKNEIKFEEIKKNIEDGN